MNAKHLFLVIVFFHFNCVGFSQEESPLLASFEEYQKAKEETLFHLDWIQVGPTLNSARVEAVQVDPKNPSTMYVAFGSGNLWKTTNNGLSWKPIFENQAALGIGDIALAPSDASIIYVGTGESLRKNRNFTMPGTGIYRSDDGGESWRHLGLEDSWHISEISVHPTNPDIVFVAVMGKFWSKDRVKGIYRTQNGGKTWEQVLYVDENTRANDVVIAPSQPNVIYASMWENNPDTLLFESVYGPKSGIYKSEDGGDNWEQLENGLPNGPKTGRIGLAVSYSNPDKAYALIDNQNNLRQKAAEVYKTIDGGTSWQKTHQDSLMIFSVIGWYFTDIYVNPQDDEEIFGLGVRIAHSDNGGKTFNLISGQVKHFTPSPAQTLHLDHCEMWVNPLNPSHLVLGNDGGLYVSYDKGSSWMHYNNIPAGEFYHITVDNQEPYMIYGGVQDDATVYGPAVEYDDRFEDRWKYLWIDAWSGGDGCVTQVDPDDPNTVYFSLQEGVARRRDIQADTSIGIRPRLPKDHPAIQNYNFVTPYIISPHNSKTLYHAGNFLFKSTNRGDSWDLISRDLSLSSQDSKIGFAAGALEESYLQQGLLYVGTDRGAFWVSKDDGKNWEEKSKGIPDNYIRSICPSKHKKERVYVCLTGINYDDLGSYIYVSEDFGTNWKSIKNNLPKEPTNVILEDPIYENILYAGLYRGVYISFDRGENWFLMSSDIPAASIADLKIQSKTNDLVIASHGRGIYFLNLDPIHSLYKKGITSEQAQFFGIPSITEPKKRDTHKDVDLQTVEKAIFSFWLPHSDEVTLSIFNEKKEQIWSKAMKGKKGMNQFRWDSIIKKTTSNLPYFIHYNSYIKSGNYEVVIEGKDFSLKQPFKVKKFMY